MNPGDVAQSVLPLTSSDLSLITLFLHAHWLVKCVMIGLLAASVWVWAIVVDKLMLYARTRRAMDRFEQAFWSGQSLEDLYKALSARPAARHEGDLHGRLDQKLTGALDALMQHDRSALHLKGYGHDLKDVVHPRGLAKVDRHRADHEGKARRLLRCLLEQRALVSAEQPQVVGPAALHEAQIARVIDHAGKVRVFIIDANGK